GNNLGETISYDVMGNITSLTRDNFSTNNYTGYDGNRLTAISGFTNGTYSYDANGNQKTNTARGITNIDYNYLNLPVSVTGPNVNYTYTAAGQKLQKQAGGATTNYIAGIQYTNSSIDFIQTEEGLARRNGSNYSYEYNLSDHLGNVRVTFYQNPNTNQLEVLQRDDYYAFGLRKEPVAKAGLNKYLYNGKELQEELGQYDYGARFYDPVIGRFNTIDPMSEISRRYSPYSYGMNNPVRFIDVDGMYADDPPWKKLLDFLGIGTQSPRTEEEVIQKAEGQKRLSGLDARNKQIEKNLDKLDYIPGLGSAMKISKGTVEKDNTTVVAGLGMGMLDIAGGKVAGKVVETAGPVLREILQKEGGQVVAKLFNSVDGLLENVALSSTKKGATQGFIKGDGEAIFKTLSKGGKQLGSGAVELSNGTTLFNHYSTKTGQYTLDINKGGEIFKIRINP
ncbi:hypothetical protein DBR40_05500, partial [Pedobacter sp. KBW01]|uniref:RHS repeat domain-containing protein n=1 Tax=Pedobacter sp. KBW01 TaxID=2153364 RepID=UPI000FBE8C26